MRALVTGGAGFIGSHLVDELVAEGAEVIVLDDLSTGALSNLNPQAELIEGDVADPEAMAKAVSGCEVVFHQAAHRAVLRSVEHPLDTDRANTAGTLNVLACAQAAGVRRVVCASSSSVYGGAEILPTPETAPLIPRSPYAVSKLAGEHYCRVFFELHGLVTVSLRYFNVYGPRQRPDSQYAAVIPLFIDALRSGRAPVVHGDGKQSRAFVFVRDAVRANLLASTAPVERCGGRAFNVASDRPYDLLQLLEMIGDLLGQRMDPVHADPRPGDVRHSLADLTAVRDAIGFEPTVAMPEGLRRTVEWLQSQRPAAAAPS